MIARRLMLAGVVSLSALSGTLALGSVAARAAAPEAPGVVTVDAVRATGAVLRGVLDPSSESEAGTYEFIYRASKTECQGGAKAQLGLALGTMGQEVSEGLSGLEPDTEYAVCLLARNLNGETAVGPAATFKTTLVIETPQTETAGSVTATTATLRGMLNPGAPGELGTYEFLYKASTDECEGGLSIAGGGSALGKQGEAVSVPVTGLLPHTEYTFCLLARNEAGETAVGTPVQKFMTPAEAPTVENEPAANVGSTVATLSARINPGGAPATYRVDYGTSEQYGLSTTEASIGSGSEAVAVQVQLTGLLPGRSYYFRFVATNANGTAEGIGLPFATTQSTGPSALVLPDHRAYELVSPVENPGEVYVPQGPVEPDEDAYTDVPARAAADGDSVVYVGDPAATGGTGSIGKGLGDTFFASRGAQGWAATDIQPPGISQFSFQSFSDDLSFEVTKDKQALTGDVLPGCEALYLRRMDESRYEPLFTGSEAEGGKCGSPVYADASADDSHFIFQDAAALITGVESSTGRCGKELGPEPRAQCNLYDSSGGRLWLVNVLPDGKQANSATFGGRTLEQNGELKKRPNFDNVISEDGSRIFWTDLESGSGEGRIFVRENDTQPQSPLGSGEECLVTTDACTVAVSQGVAQYWAASKDGRYVIYTEGGRLLRFDVDRGTRTELAGAGAGVVGVVGSSSDGSYVYFVATGALTGTENREKEKAKARTCVPLASQQQQLATEFYNEEIISQEEFTSRSAKIEMEVAEEREGLIPPTTGCNLYIAQPDGTLRFIATLSPKDNDLPGASSNLAPYGDWQADMGSRTAQVTPDGRHLIFESVHRLTGYDSHFFPDVSGETPVETEAFVYDQASEQLACATCIPSGAAPVEEITPTFLPVSSSPTFMRRWISEDGTRAFFDTSQPLTAQDVNGRQDVYEWEQEGASGCPVEARSRLNGGCLYLLSGGGGTDFSYLLDSSATGGDVFFATRAQLLPQDGNEKVDLYDARVDGGFPEVALGCTGTGCQGVPPSAPIFATPSSVTFTGVGNFELPSNATVTKKKSKPKGCKRGYVKRHGKCVKRKTKKLAPRGARSKRGVRS